MNNEIFSVYVSLTSIFKKQSILIKTLKCILNQTRIPDKIFIYLSEEPYILDDGFKDKQITHHKLINLINNNSIINVR